MFRKLSVQELLTPGSNSTIPFQSKTEGGEQVLIQAIEANKKYSKSYNYNSFPQILQIANYIGKSTDFASPEFARNVFVYQVDRLGIPKDSADGQFDPPLIQQVAKRGGLDLSQVIVSWKRKMKGGWMGHKWAGRRHQGLVKGVYKYPVKSAQIVGSFTGAKPSDKYHSSGHWGLDLGNVPKGTPVFPIAPGTVVAAGDFGKGGNGIKIDHGNGVVSYYAHMSGLNVKKGDEVDFNTVIGGVGNSGYIVKDGKKYGTSVHLHFETKVNGTKVNPKNVIGKPIKTSQ